LFGGARDDKTVMRISRRRHAFVVGRLSRSVVELIFPDEFVGVSKGVVTKGKWPRERLMFRGTRASRGGDEERGQQRNQRVLLRHKSLRRKLSLQYQTRKCFTTAGA